MKKSILCLFTLCLLSAPLLAVLDSIYPIDLSQETDRTYQVFDTIVFTHNGNMSCHLKSGDEHANTFQISQADSFVLGTNFVIPINTKMNKSKLRLTDSEFRIVNLVDNNNPTITFKLKALKGTTGGGKSPSTKIFQHCVYDALILADKTTKDKYFKTLSKYKPISSKNPFLKQDVLKSSFQLNSPEVTSLINKQASTGSPDVVPSVSSAISTASGLNVTKYADGIAKFLVDRTKQELSIAFFDKFKQELEKYPDLGTLFPQTLSTLQLIDQEIYMYKRYLTTLREEFNNDLNALPDNFSGIVENHPEFFEEIPGLDALLTEMSGFVADIRDEVHPGKALEELDPSGFAQIDTNLTASFQTIQLLSVALRDTSSGDNAQYWAPKSMITKLISNETAFDIFLGLLYEQARQKKILFSRGDSLHVLIDSLGSKKGQVKTKYKEIKRLIREISTHGDRLNKQIKKQAGSEEKMSLADVLSYFDNIMDILDASSRLPKALPFKARDKINLKQVERGIDIGRNMSQMVAHVANQKYAAGVANAIHLYDAVFDKNLNVKLTEYNNYYKSEEDYNASVAAIEKELESLKISNKKCKEFEQAYMKGSAEIIKAANVILPGISTVHKSNLEVIDQYLEQQKDSPTIKALLKYGTFMANVAEAEDSDAVAATIDQFALPVGSWRIKRQATFNVSLQAYLGIGHYWTDRKKDEDKPTRDSLRGITLHAPVGLSVSTSLWNKRSASFFFSLIDVGAIASFRFDDNETEIADIFLKEIISPGVFLSISPCPKVPFVINAGYQRAARLKDVGADKNTLIEHSGRWSVSLLVDIPIANLYNKSKQ